ncbi:MAG TPA: NAD(P)H-hydrate dehydratase [Acidiphilium sp.]
MSRMEPLFTPREMAAIDGAAPEHGVASLDLMENAGRAVARAVLRRFSPCRVLVLAGPGNNGGDGYVVARLLAERGWPVTVMPVAAPRAGSDAAIAAGRWRGRLAAPDVSRAASADLVIDAVFGAGLARDIAPDIAELLAAAKTLIAIDIPSGVDGATGAIRGFAPRATLTMTFVARKPGHLLYPGRAQCGETVCADIGMPAGAIAAITPGLWRNTPGLWRLPGLGASGHKYDRGHVTILAGEMSGAAILAGNAALRAGAGLVTLAADHPVAAPPGLIVRTGDPVGLLVDSRRKVWLCGPGLGAGRAGDLLDTLIAAGRTVVADADALTACAGTPDRLRGVAVITPHAGEFARLFPGLDGNRLAAARAAAARTGAIVILKGADTVIAAPDGRAAINDNAPPTLATAGSGDTLAGIVAALLAQGGAHGMDRFEAACAAVWLHGEAARRVGPGLIAEDLADALPEAIRAATRWR